MWSFPSSHGEAGDFPLAHGLFPSQEVFSFKYQGAEISQLPRNGLLVFVEPRSKQVRPEDVYSAEEGRTCWEQTVCGVAWRCFGAPKKLPRLRFKFAFSSDKGTWLFVALQELEEKVYYVDPQKDYPLNLDHVTQPIIYFRPGDVLFSLNRLRPVQLMDLGT